MQPNAENRRVQMLHSLLFVFNSQLAAYTKCAAQNKTCAHCVVCQVLANMCVCVRVRARRSFECKGLPRCPLGSCDCAKAERRVQRAAARRKSLLLRFANRKLPPAVVLSRQEIYVGERGWNQGVRKKQACDSCRWGKAASIFLALRCL